MSQINISNNPSAEVIIYENGTPVHVSVEGFVVTWGDIHGTLSAQTDLQTALDGKVDENSPITGATKTKITYDSKGLVTSGTDAAVADISGLQTALDLKVPYTGATGNVNLGEYGLTTGYVQLDTTPTTYTPAVGNIGWNDTTGTIQTTLKGGTSLMIGRDMFERVVNKTGVQLTRAAYQAVRISNAQGQRLGVALAQANNDGNSADTVGIAVETIDVNQEGMIFTVGEITGINTTGSLQGETWADGDVLYLSPTTAGRITNVKPVAPQHLVIIGYVTYAHQNNGKIYVKTMNGWELDELHNVKITSPTNGQVLKYNSSTQVWENNTDAAGTGTVTQVNATGGTGISVSGSPITTSGTLTITNTAPDQVVSLTQGGTTTITGTYPNFTVSSADQYQGTVTSASVVSANGFAGTVANSTTTPAITLSTSVTGLLKGDGTAISAAIAGTDYQAALTNPVTGTGTSGQVSFWTGTTSQSGSNNLFWDNANGRLGIGTNAPTHILTVGTAAAASLAPSGFRTVSTNQNDGNFSALITSSSTDSTHRPSFVGVRSRGTLASPTAVQSGDWISTFLSAGYDGSALQYSSGVLFQVDGAVSSGNVPQSIDLLTGTSGSNRSSKLRVGSNGNVIIQNGGAFTYAGFRLDVNGTARIQGNLTTNLTSGSVPFIGASGLMTQDNSNLFWDNTNKRLGIGTSTLTGTTRLRIVADSTNENLWMDRFAAVPTFIFRRANGTESSPTAVLNNDIIGGIGFRGYNGSAFTTISQIFINSYATENWTTGATGADLRFETTATGGTTRTEKMRIFSGGNVTIQSGGTFTDNGYRLDVQGTLRVTGASQFEGNVTLTDADNLVFGTTTGTKIGTSTSQKLAFYNSTPIVQPTTGVAAATRVSVAGNTVTDADTFDGYTIPQLVKAMRNLGLLA